MRFKVWGRGRWRLPRCKDFKTLNFVGKNLIFPIKINIIFQYFFRKLLSFPRDIQNAVESFSNKEAQSSKIRYMIGILEMRHTKSSVALINKVIEGYFFESSSILCFLNQYFIFTIIF